MATKRKVNVRRLTTLALHMEKLPDEAAAHFRMDRWFQHNGDHPLVKKGQLITMEHMLDCGTSACAAGWATTVPSFRRAGLKLIVNRAGNDMVVYRGMSSRDNYKSLKNFFGLTQEQAHDLFGPNSAYDSSCRTTKITTPAGWAAYCRQFIIRVDKRRCVS